MGNRFYDGNWKELENLIFMDGKPCKLIFLHYTLRYYNAPNTRVIDLSDYKLQQYCPDFSLLLHLAAFKANFNFEWFWF